MKTSSWFFIAAFLMIIGDIVNDDLFEDSILAIIFCTAWVINAIEKKSK
jgi:hypothetical protein